MAWENLDNPITIPASTGLTQHRFVIVNTSGNLAYPAAGAPVDGVLVSSGTTASTSDRQVGSVQVRGVAKVSAPASTVAVGDLVTASSVGQAVPSSAGDYVVGRVVAGSSGGAGRILSVLIMPIGTT